MSVNRMRGDAGILEALAQFDRREFADFGPALGGDLAVLGVGADHDAAGIGARRIFHEKRDWSARPSPGSRG